MSKRVYEIARELSLGTKEVMERLKEAGVEVNNHFAAVEDPVYKRVFCQGSAPTTTAVAPVGAGGVENGRSEGPATPAGRESVGEARKEGKGGRKRRRVVIDASATNRGPRPTVAETRPKKPRRTPEEAAEANREEK